LNTNVYTALIFI